MAEEIYKLYIIRRVLVNAPLEMALMKYFYEVREEQPNIDEDIRDILAKHRNPATAIPVHNIRGQRLLERHLTFGSNS